MFLWNEDNCLIFWLCSCEAFEAYLWGSWQPVERLRIKDGIITMHVIDGKKVVEENIPMPNLRLRSRKATISDCSCLLRPGIDVCVLSNPDIETTDKKKNSSPVSSQNCSLKFQYLLIFKYGSLADMLIL